MTDQWTPPSQLKPRSADLDGLGLPPGRYGLPTFGEYVNATDGDYGRENTAAFKRLEKHFEGELALTELPERDVQFLRHHFGQQHAEQIQRAVAYFDNRVPRRYAGAHPDDSATAWATAAVHDPEGTRSLLIVGPTGTGKTHYAWSVLRAYAQTGFTGWKALTAADLYASLRPRAGRDTDSEFDSLAEAGVLFVDDLAAAKLTEWTEEITYRLINRRYEQCQPCIFTSNVPPQQLLETLGERVASRLTEMCERITLKGEDRRKGLAA